jgi:hypothetical protein
LVEVLVSACVLTIGLLATFRLQIDAIRMDRQTILYSKALGRLNELIWIAQDGRQNLARNIDAWQRQAAVELPNLNFQMCLSAPQVDMQRGGHCDAPQYGSTAVIKLGWSDGWEHDGPQLMIPILLLQQPHQETPN